MEATLHFSYKMKLLFSELVTNHHFSAKINPKSNLRQTILWTDSKIRPFDMMKTGWDGFGNEVFYGSSFCPHKEFTISLEGEAITRSKGPEEKAIWSEGLTYKYPTSYTTPGKEIRLYYEQNREKVAEADPRKNAEFWMKSLGQIMHYARGTTDITTTAEQAFAQNCGVCQDYAHILITLLRLQEIPARYVVGMIEGEGESHAWVEVLAEDNWYGIDPTNGLWVNENYIKISSGRDYQDCIISQGTFEGVVSQSQSIHVNVVKKKEG